MTANEPATVLFGDIVDSRRDPGATAFLRALRIDLDEAYRSGDRLAAFGFTQGDELQGLLAPGVDPFAAVVRAALRPDARAMRWSIVAGEVEPGPGPATERTGPAFHRARDLLAEARARRDGMSVRTGDAGTDALLDDLAPLLPALLDRLTPRQREVVRLLLVDGFRRADAAERLGVSRATVSVIAERGRAREIGRLARALAVLFREGTTRAVPGQPATAPVASPAASASPA